MVTHSLSHTNSLSHIHTHSYWLILIQTRVHRHTHTYPYTSTLRYHTQTQTHALTRIRAHSHAPTRSCTRVFVSFWLSWAIRASAEKGLEKLIEKIRIPIRLFSSHLDKLNWTKASPFAGKSLFFFRFIKFHICCCFLRKKTFFRNSFLGGGVSSINSFLTLWFVQKIRRRLILKNASSSSSLPATNFKGRRNSRVVSGATY